MFKYSLENSVNTKHRIVYVVPLLLGLGLMAWQTIYFWDFFIDDSYIGFRVARNVARGHGFVYNVGEFVEGYTNFLWVAVMALVQFVIGTARDVSNASKVLGEYSAVCILVMAWWIGGGLGARGRWRVGPGRVALPLLIAAHTSLAAWAVSGMETVFAAALVFAGFMLLVRGGGRRMGVGLAVMALAAMARFDHVVFFAVAVIFCGAWSVARDGANTGLKKLLRMAWPALAIYAAYTIFRIVSYVDFSNFEGLRDLQPNTALAKTGHSWLSHHFWKLYVIMYGYVFFGPLILLRAGAAARRREFGPLLGAALVIAYLIYLYWYCYDWMPGFRLFRSVEPLLIVLVWDALAWAGVGGMRALIAAGKWKSSRREIFHAAKRWGLAFSFAGGLIFAAHLCLWAQLDLLPAPKPGTTNLPWLLEPATRHNILDGYRMNAELAADLADDSHALGALLEPHHVVYTDLGGAPAYYTEARILECFGLTNRTIAREGRRNDPEITALFTDWFQARFHPEYIARVQPDYFLITGLSVKERQPWDFAPELVTGWPLLKRFQSLGPEHYRAGYLWSPARPKHYIYFLEKRGVERGAFRGAAMGYELRYEDD